MKALIATTRYLLLVDVPHRIVTPLEGNRPEYYGISWHPGSSDIVLSHSGIDNAELVDIATYAQSETGWISSGSLSSPNFLSQPHQIFCASDGRVVCTNTGRNAISVIDMKRHGHFQEARISPERWDRLSPDNFAGDHLNSVFEQNGNLYVIAHRFNKGSMLAVFSYPELELLTLEPTGSRSGLHNIWITKDGQQIACHSESGSVVDLQSGEVLWEAGSPVYTRGLAATADIALVGESRKTGRDLRSCSLSGLWVIDRKSWKAIDYLCLGPYGAVNEVRLLDVPDEAHHGHPYAGIDELVKQDMRNVLSTQRIAVASAANEGRIIWKDFVLILGSPETGSRGSRTALPVDLCLVAVKEPIQARSIAFDYSLDTSASVSHVSAVVGYQGSGGDVQMYALLLQPFNYSATMRLWRHDGTEWAPVEGVGVDDMPLSGSMKVLLLAGGMLAYVDGRETLRIDDLPSETLAGRLGMRWIGATISNPECAE